MERQGTGAAVHTLLYLLVYPQQPMVKTKTIELINYDKLRLMNSTANGCPLKNGQRYFMCATGLMYTIQLPILNGVLLPTIVTITRTTITTDMPSVGSHPSD